MWSDSKSEVQDLYVAYSVRLAAGSRIKAAHEGVVLSDKAETRIRLSKV